MRKGPACKWCARNLRPNRPSKEFPTADEAIAFANTRERPRIRPYFSDRFIVSYQEGWGDNGEGHFCGGRCAELFGRWVGKDPVLYRAVWAAEKAKKGATA